MKLTNISKFCCHGLEYIKPAMTHSRSYVTFKKYTDEANSKKPFQSNGVQTRNYRKMGNKNNGDYYILLLASFLVMTFFSTKRTH